jgi:hypothetical protein
MSVFLPAGPMTEERAQLWHQAWRMRNEVAEILIRGRQRGGFTAEEIARLEQLLNEIRRITHQVRAGVPFPEVLDEAEGVINRYKRGELKPIG